MKSAGVLSTVSVMNTSQFSLAFTKQPNTIQASIQCIRSDYLSIIYTISYLNGNLSESSQTQYTIHHQYLIICDKCIYIYVCIPY